MVKLNRFIQFNDETIDANMLLLYEKLGRALAGAPYLNMTERKLFEFEPLGGNVSLSVFWRHRTDSITHAGRLSDVYLLTVGFWKHFSVREWLDFRKTYGNHPLRKFAEELLLMLEEYRLMDVVVKQRPGTAQAFSVRRKLMLQFHHDLLKSNFQKGFLADALINHLYITLHEGILSDLQVDWHLPIEHIQRIAIFASDAHSTSEMSDLTKRIIFMVEEILEQDLVFQYYAVGDSVSEKTAAFHYHDGMKDAEKGEEGIKETIEEIFRTWHRETEDESGVHLEYEIEHGRSGKSEGSEAVEGNDNAQIDQIGKGRSTGDENQKRQQTVEERKEDNKENDRKKAGVKFGKENANVVYIEELVKVQSDEKNRYKLQQWREQQKPYVRSFVEEIKKRIEMKVDSRRTGLMKGRLSSNLLTMAVDERPRPFYKKNSPAKNLDAVFGLLVDGSASMMDKLDETKEAVLLFHDVLRQLSVRHEISSYYEDAEQATKDIQPNVFGLMHTFEDVHKDDGMTILSFETNEDNRDGFAIRWMADRLVKRGEKHKFLLVFSDGEPSAFGYDRNGILDTREAVMEVEKQGISVIHLFLSTDNPTDDQRSLFSMMFGNKSAASDSVEDFSDQTLRILRKLLSIVISQ